MTIHQEQTAKRLTFLVLWLVGMNQGGLVGNLLKSAVQTPREADKRFPKHNRRERVIGVLYEGEERPQKLVRIQGSPTEHDIANLAEALVISSKNYALQELGFDEVHVLTKEEGDGYLWAGKATKEKRRIEIKSGVSRSVCSHEVGHFETYYLESINADPGKELRDIQGSYAFVKRFKGGKDKLEYTEGYIDDTKEGAAYCHTSPHGGLNEREEYAEWRESIINEQCPEPVWNTIAEIGLPLDCYETKLKIFQRRGLGRSAFLENCLEDLGHKRADFEMFQGVKVGKKRNYSQDPTVNYTPPNTKRTNPKRMLRQ